MQRHGALTWVSHTQCDCSNGFVRMKKLDVAINGSFRERELVGLRAA
jgi:hypothetical protein